MASLVQPGLNARDANLQHRGYYENLDLRGQLNSELWDVVGVRSEDWRDLGGVGALQPRDDMRLIELKPDLQLRWNNASLTTNRWGMRDRDYEQEKAPGTLRIALLGPSHAMGNNVSDAETFENLLEERLAREPIPELGGQVEVLNFAVDGYTFPSSWPPCGTRCGCSIPTSSS
jgi:hypothetical protein